MDAVSAHYAVGGIEKRILDAVAATGIPMGRLTVDDLAPADEFHVGGRAATEALVEVAELPPGGHVLDVGSGLGGTARFLAAIHHHRVTGVDVTEEYVSTARTLTRLLGLDDRVAFHLASALDLPFGSERFDAAVQLHVGMNIADKAALFAEVRRVIRPGARLAIYDVMGPPDADIDFPVPWATSPENSHLATPDAYTELLRRAGFEIRHLRDRRAFAVGFFASTRTWSGEPSPLGLHLVIGPDAAIRVANMARAVDRGSVAPVEIVAEKRAAPS